MLVKEFWDLTMKNGFQDSGKVYIQINGIVLLSIFHIMFDLFNYMLQIIN